MRGGLAPPIYIYYNQVDLTTGGLAMRTGLSRFIILAHALCVLFGRWRGSIIAAINASNATEGQKTQLLGLISAIDASCAAVDAVRTVWES